MWEDGAVSEPVQVAADKAEVSVLKMHHVCTVGTWGGEASKGKLLTASLESGQDVATSSQPERETCWRYEICCVVCV